MQSRIELLVLWIAVQAISTTIQVATAGVIERDWKVSGDELLLFDDVHRREWLDVTETTGFSIQSIEPELDLGGDFEGFQVASVDDVLGLATSSGIPIDSASPRVDKEGLWVEGPSIGQFVFAIGYTRNGSFGEFWSIGLASTDGSNIVESRFHTREFVDGSIDLFAASYDPSFSSGETGVWLFRPVPEPSNLAYCGSAILAALLFRRQVPR